MSQKTIFAEIAQEREYQDKKWGTDFDDMNTVNDWVAYIAQYAGKAASFDYSQEEQRKAILKVASLAVAALEAFDRNGKFADRHYD